MPETKFSAWLKETMAHEGLRSRQDLARSLGVARTTVHYWLTGEREPDDVNVAILARRFGVSRARIYELLGRMEPTSDAEMADIMELWHEATPEERAEILDYFRYRLSKRKRNRTSRPQ